MGDNFICEGENNMCDVCYGLFKQVKEKDIVRIWIKKMRVSIKNTMCP